MEETILIFFSLNTNYIESSFIYNLNECCSYLHLSILLSDTSFFLFIFTDTNNQSHGHRRKLHALQQKLINDLLLSRPLKFASSHL